MKKSDIKQSPCYFDKYISLIEDIEVCEAFSQSIDTLDGLDVAKFERIGNRVYAASKWTIKDIFRHLIDSEHVLAYRVLRIGRNDKTQLPGFDEAEFAANVSTENRSLKALIEELKIVRTATSLLFASFDDNALHRSGTISGNHMSVLAYGFAIVGHQKHHLRIIEEKYL